MLIGRKIAPVQELDGKLCMIPHLLHGLRRPLPTKRGTHDWVSLDQSSATLRRWPSGSIDLHERYNDLLDVNARIRPA